MRHKDRPRIRCCSIRVQQFLRRSHFEGSQLTRRRTQTLQTNRSSKSTKSCLCRLHDGKLQYCADLGHSVSLARETYYRWVTTALVGRHARQNEQRSYLEALLDGDCQRSWRCLLVPRTTLQRHAPPPQCTKPRVQWTLQDFKLRRAFQEKRNDPAIAQYKSKS